MCVKWCKSDEKCMKICPFSLGVAFGAAKGLYLMLLAWVAMFFGYGADMVNHISSYHHAYDASFKGGLIGGLEGLVCGFIFGFAVAYIYDWCVCYRKKSDDPK